MAQCSNCHKDLKESEGFDLVRFQLWKTTAGSKECKSPDMDKTRIFCSPCAQKGQINLWKS